MRALHGHVSEEPFHPVVNCGVLTCAHEILVCDCAVPQAKVVAYRASEKKNVLGNAGERVDEDIARNLVARNTVEKNFSAP